MGNITSKIHVWIGESKKNKEEFSEYFAVNRNDVESGVGGSQFCKDLGINWYDDDLIGVYKSDSNNDLQITLNELPISPQKIHEIFEICVNENILTANALFYYSDANLVVPDKEKQYNGLIYVGCFDWE